MPKTNQKLLSELKTRLPNFTYEELHFLMNIIEPAQKEFNQLSKLIIQELKKSSKYA